MISIQLWVKIKIIIFNNELSYLEFTNAERVKLTIKSEIFGSEYD